MAPGVRDMAHAREPQRPQRERLRTAARRQGAWIGRERTNDGKGESDSAGRGVTTGAWGNAEGGSRCTDAGRGPVRRPADAGVHGSRVLVAALVAYGPGRLLSECGPKARQRKAQREARAAPPRSDGAKAALLEGDGPGPHTPHPLTRLSAAEAFLASDRGRRAPRDTPSSASNDGDRRGAGQRPGAERPQGDGGPRGHRHSARRRRRRHRRQGVGNHAAR